MEFSIVVVRNKATQRGWRVAVAAAFAVALGLVAVVGLPVPFELLSR
jgi:Na+/H+ antiporter NhaA